MPRFASMRVTSIIASGVTVVYREAPPMQLFERIEAPASQACWVSGAQWNTWSVDFRHFLRAYGGTLAEAPRPVLRHILDGRPYDYTFSISFSEVSSQLDLSALHEFAVGLYDLQFQADRLIFLDRLLNRDLSGNGLQWLFAFFRETIVRLAGDEMAALSTPLGRVGPSVAGFPLHADLYPAETLFNVFDEVPSDDSGASLFLDFATLTKLMSEIAGVPSEIKELVHECREDVLTTDRFEDFYSALHSGNTPWKAELERAMLASAERIRLHGGQGYLLNDRKWLHGREAPTGGVSGRRLHRLVFNRRAQQERRAKLSPTTG
jgi:hypothetical protein